MKFGINKVAQVVCVLALLVLAVVTAGCSSGAPEFNQASYDQGVKFAQDACDGVVSEKDSKISELSSEIESLKINNEELSNQNVALNAKFDEYDLKLADVKQDEEAYQLVIDEVLNDKDFDEDLMDWMNDELGTSIEDEDDLSWKVTDNKIDWEERDDGQCEVMLYLKVKYHNDGDDDDDHTERLILTADIDDDDLEDVEDWDLDEE